MLLTSSLSASDVRAAVEAVSADDYAGNVILNECRDDGTRRDGRHKVRFTLRTKDGHKWGSRTTQSGAHYPLASWEAHRDVMRLIYFYDPAAVIVAGRTTYEGEDHFQQTYEASGDWNVGTIMHPQRLRDLTVPRD